MPSRSDLRVVTVSIGWIAGGLTQPAAYSVANDDISDLGADTASSSWIYNRIGANLTGSARTRALAGAEPRPARRGRGRA
jgi:hypothetical protein